MHALVRRGCPQSIVLLAYEKAHDVRALVEQVKASRYAVQFAREAEKRHPIRDVRDTLRKSGGNTTIATALLLELQVRTKMIAMAVDIKNRNS